MALPFLPGNSFNNNLGKEMYHKSHCFDKRNDVSVYVGEHKSGIGGDPLPGGKPKPKRSAYPRGAASQAPAWVAFDRQVLCFDAYFQEAVHEKSEEQFRVRRCKIYFYLEDDSIQVIEPRAENSGIPQGTLIRRHRIPLPSPYDDEFYTVEHFNVGKDITLYSRTFKVTGCDEFTRNFLRKLGNKVPDSTCIPEDPHTKHRQQVKESMQPLRPYETLDTLRQFLENDRRVLRFFCLWDDTNSMFGDPREMILHYFLADDTVEIREVVTQNSGRDAVPLFLRRQRLPKEPGAMPEPGKITERTVLNVFGPMGQGGRYILDSLKTGAVHTDFYHDSDLMIGTVINVWGRRFIICDCDEFTKDYFKSKYGIDDFTPINYKAELLPLKEKEIPPYNGFGSEEDSICNCLSLIPKPPRRDFIKFMEKDRHGLNSNVLRFVARMDTTRPIDLDRRFIVSYFLSDDTILVFEPPQRNSGIIGGKFLERRRIKKPDGVNYFSAQDLFIGNTVEFCKHPFILIDADGYAIEYMEVHADEFPQANMTVIMPKLARLAFRNKDQFMNFASSLDTSGSGKMSFDDFSKFVLGFGEDALSLHEVLTVSRYFGEIQVHICVSKVQRLRKEMSHELEALGLQPKEDNLEVLVSTVQEELRKVNYETFAVMMDACVYQDQEGTGFIDGNQLRNIVKSFNVPVKDHLLRLLLERTEENESGQLNYKQLIGFLNWRDTPVQSQKFAPSLAYGVEIPDRIGPAERLKYIHYKPLMEALGFKQDQV